MNPANIWKVWDSSESMKERHKANTKHGSHKGVIYLSVVNGVNLSVEGGQRPFQSISMIEILLHGVQVQLVEGKGENYKKKKIFFFALKIMETWIIGLKWILEIT